LNEMPWRDAEAYFKENDAVIFPIGCVHAHDHIPLGIDNMSAEVLAKRVGEKTKTLVIPTLNYGWMPQYMDYPGTLNIESRTFMDIIMQVCSCLEKWGVRRIAFINGHGGNTPYLLEVGYSLRERGMLCPVFEWWKIIQKLDPALSKEASSLPNSVSRPGITRGTETAVAMALGDFMDPADIRVLHSKNLLGSPFEQIWFQGVEFEGVPIPLSFKTREVMEDGPAGTCATAHHGQRILDLCTDFISRFLEAFKKAPMP